MKKHGLGSFLRSLCLATVLAVFFGSVPAAAASGQEGEWSGFVEELAGRFGVMSTEEMSMPNDWTSPTVWQGADLTGLLSAAALDLDGDGQQELFTVRLDNFGEDLYGYGNYTDTTHLYLSVYEPGGSEPTAERMLFLYPEMVGYQGPNSQFTVFTYDYDGVCYICLDNYATMNETQTIVDFFRYDGAQLVFAGGAAFEEYGEGSVYVRRADAEPASVQAFNQAASDASGTWQEVMAFRVDEEQRQILQTEEERPYYEAYADVLAEYGLLAGEDGRIWFNQTGDRSGYFGLTALDVYTAVQGEIRPIASVIRYSRDDGGSRTLDLLRADWQGTLDSFR